MKVEKNQLVILVGLLRYGRLQLSEIIQMIEGGERPALAVREKLLDIPGIYSIDGRDLCTFAYLSTNRIFRFYGKNNKVASLREAKHRSIPKTLVPSSLEAMTEFYS